MKFSDAPLSTKCDTWVCEYGGGGKDMAESGSISLFTAELS